MRFIERDSSGYARQVAAGMIYAIERAALFPRSGRVLPEFDDPDLRDLIVHSYRVIYRVGPDVVHVAAIVHGARDLHRAIGNRTN